MNHAPAVLPRTLRPGSARMVAAVKAVRVAERLLQVDRDDDTAQLFDLSHVQREHYMRAAAAALDLVGR